MASVCSLSAFAQEAPKIGTKGSVTLTLKDLDTSAPISGSKFQVYKVADLSEIGGFHYEYSGGFTSLKDNTEYNIKSGGKLDTDADAKALASSLSDFIKTMGEKITPLHEITTDAAGTASISNLDLGLYLFVNSAVADTAKYEICNPFLVTVPRDDGTGKLIYNIDAYPKPGTKSVPTPPGPPGPPDIPTPPPGGTPTAPCGTIHKVVTGIDGKYGIFEFTIERLDANYPMPVNSSGLVESGGHVVSVSGNALVLQMKGAGDMTIGDLSFDKEGDYYYQASETKAVGDYIKDTSVYWLKFEVRKSGENLVIQRILLKKGGAEGTVVYDGTDPAGLTMGFTNRYHNPGGGSGDNTPPGGSGDPPSGGTPSTGENVPEGEVLGAERDPGSGTPTGSVLGANRKVLGANRLPKTGQLWWPVPVLLAAGLLFMGKGLIDDRNSKTSRH